MQESNLEFLLKKTLEDFIKVEVAADREAVFPQLLEIYDAIGSKQFVVKLPDGEKVATFTIHEPKSTDQVDDEALIQWLEDNGYDDQVLTRTIPEKVIPAHEEKAIKTGVLGAIGATLTSEGVYVTPHGEVIEGIERVPAERPKRFAVKYEEGNEGRRKVIQAWRNGELNHLVEGTILPQIEGPKEGE